MGAVRKLFEDDMPEYIRPARGFKRPTVEEVAQYIREYMGWPMDFCTHYAQKFHDYYQKQGWMQSNKTALKDWQAAFRNVWTEPKNDKDKKMLMDSIAKEKKGNPYTYLNECLEKHKVGQYKPSREECIGVYDFLKAKGMMKLPRDTVNKIVEEAGNSREKGKMLAVKYLFDKMVFETKAFI